MNIQIANECDFTDAEQRQHRNIIGSRNCRTNDLLGSSNFCEYSQRVSGPFKQKKSIQMSLNMINFPNLQRVFGSSLDEIQQKDTSRAYIANDEALQRWFTTRLF